MKDWFLCLLEIKGNFYINMGVRNGRVFIQPVFTLRLKKDDLKILEELKREIGAGEIKVGKNATFLVRGIGNLLKFLEKVNEEKFLTSKKNDFLLWKEAVLLIKDYKHLSKEGFLRICEIRDKINLRRKRKNYKNKKFFENLMDELKMEFKDVEKRRKISSALRLLHNLKGAH